MKALFCLLSLLCLLSCSKATKEINDKSYLLGSSGKIMIVDSLLFVLDYPGEHMFYINL